jgi:hypothetical protein
MTTLERRKRSYCAMSLPIWVGVAMAVGAVVLTYGAQRALGASKDDLPKAEFVLDKVVQATGGKARFDKIDNSVIKGTIEIAPSGIKMDMTICQARPNLMYSLIESEAFGKIEKGVSGDVAWEVSLMAGPQVYKDQQKADALRQAIFQHLVYWRDVYAKAECTGTEKVADKDCYKVVLTPKDGEPLTMYVDRETFLPARTDVTIESPMGRIPLESYPGDFQEVDGTLVAHKVTVKVMGQERIMTIKSVEYNAELPPDRFKLPPEVQEIVDKQKGEKEEGDSRP